MVNFPITSSQLGRKVKQNGLLRGIGIFQPPFKNKVEAKTLLFFVSKGGWVNKVKTSVSYSCKTSYFTDRIDQRKGFLILVLTA